MKKSVFFVTLCILALSLFSCGNMLSEEVEEVYIVIDELDETMSVPVGTDLHLHLSDNSTVGYWYVDNPQKAQFYSSWDLAQATLKTILPGSVKITALVYTEEGTVEYYYSLQIIDKITINRREGTSKDNSVHVGDTVDVRMEGNTLVKWAVKDESVATFKSTSSSEYSSSSSITIKKAVGDGKIIINAMAQNGENYYYSIPVTNVMFRNKTGYKVSVRRDSLNANNIAEILPNEELSEYVASGSEETVFYFSYSQGVDDDDGTIWINTEHNASDWYSIDSVDLENRYNEISIPSPKSLRFKDAYLKIDNNSDVQCSLVVGDNQQMKTTRGTLYIQPGMKGIYKIPSNTSEISNWWLETSSKRIPIPEFQVQSDKGIYEYKFNGEVIN